MVTRPSVAVVGCGHVGAVVAACLAFEGCAAFGYDIAKTQVEALNAGVSPFFEPGLNEALAAGRASGKLSFGDDELRLDNADAFIICVDTPLSSTGVDLSNLRLALRTVANSLRRTGDSRPVILKSTTPIGEASRLRLLLCELAGRDIPFAVVPEFLRQGSAVADFRAPERIVIGSLSETASAAARRVFARPDIPIVDTDLATAELIKHGANAFLAARVSFINELSSLGLAYDCDIDAAISGIGLDSRIGTTFLRPGIGYGGSCLPRDVFSLIDGAAAAGLESPLLRAIQEVNEYQVQWAVDSVRARLGGLGGARVAAWGVTYKGGTEDTRSSPALAIIKRLQRERASVTAFDPSFSAERPAPPGVPMADSALECCTGADALLVLSDWEMFREIDLGEVRSRMRGHLVFDGRNFLEPSHVRAAGLDYLGVGRSISARADSPPSHHRQAE